MLNKIMLIGRLGADPEFTVTASGIPVAKLSLATSEKRKNPQGEVTETTEWHRITLWRRTAEVAQEYLKKGSQIYLEGKIHYDSYNNKEGQKVYSTEIIGDRFSMLDGKKDNEKNAGVAVASQIGASKVNPNEEDLPF